MRQACGNSYSLDLAAYSGQKHFNTRLITSIVSKQCWKLLLPCDCAVVKHNIAINVNSPVEDEMNIENAQTLHFIVYASSVSDSCFE